MSSVNTPDWKPVVLVNKSVAKKNIVKEPMKRFAQKTSKEPDAEINPVVMVTSSLKKKIIGARLAYTEPGSNKQGVSQERFAQLIKVKAADVKLLEQGKIDNKQAKQIALAVEKHLKIKVLQSV